jgi:hypothetical protein
MDFGGFNWNLLKFVGPIVLLAVLAWAMLRNRASRRSKAETEAGTRRVYAEEDRREGGEADRLP